MLGTITCSSLMLLNIKKNTRDRRNIRKNENKMTFEHGFLGDDQSKELRQFTI